MQQPDPWILSTEKLLERLEECREAVMNIPTLRGLDERHQWQRYALTKIVNLQDTLRYCVQYQREAQARFAKLAEVKPAKESPASRKAKLVSFRA
jgi:hypothetical protein